MRWQPCRANPREAERRSPEADVTALREKIIDKLERFKAIDDREKSAAGWTRDGEQWIPPGWVRG